MKTLIFGLNPDLFQFIGISLLHSLWQSALLSLLVFFILKWMRHANAQSRYIIAVVAIIIMFCLPIVTFIQNFSTVNSNVEYSKVVSDQNVGAATISVLPENGNLITGSFRYLSDLITNNAFIFTIFWLTGIAFMVIKFTGGVILTYRVKQSKGNICPQAWQSRFEQLVFALGIKQKVKLYESSKVNLPIVIGYFRPVILVPIGTFAQLPFDQVEMVILHELAHIRRADYLVNLIQSFIEILLFFNPFVWWISFVIRNERENCCDDLALGMNQHPVSLAKALVNFSENALNQLNTSNVFYFNKINTMKRIERMFNHQHRNPATKEKLIVSVLSFLVVAIISTTGLMANSNDTENESKEINLVATGSYIMPVSDTLSKKRNIGKDESKEVEIEMKDGKIIKAVVNGKEMTPEEFERTEGKTTDSIPSIANYKMIIYDKDGSVDGSEIEEIRTVSTNGNEKKITIINKNVNGRPVEPMHPGPKPKMHWEYKNDGQKQYDYTFNFNDSIMQDDSTMVFVYKDDFEGDSIVTIVEMDKIQQQINKEMQQYDLEIQTIDNERQHRFFPVEMPEPVRPIQWEARNHRTIQDDLWIKELRDGGYAEPFSNIVLSRKQLIIDGTVLDRKTQRRFLERYEAINNRKVENDEAISFGPR
ncbi:MAG: M56 family metallopeptidase [Bacteroidales bacterium]|nr:M56 family metallopeptidase [Bacteroidales bacterium]